MTISPLLGTQLAPQALRNLSPTPPIRQLLIAAPTGGPWEDVDGRPRSVGDSARQPGRTPPRATVEILLADDDEIYAAGLRSVAETAGDVDVVAQTADAEQALTMAGDLGAHVVVLRKRLVDDQDWPSLAKHINSGDFAVLVLGDRPTDVAFIAALRAGVVGYQPQGLSGQRFIDSIRTLHRGEPSLHEPLVDVLLRHLGLLGGHRPGPVHSPTTSSKRPVQRALRIADHDASIVLTERQRAVTTLVAQGLSNGEIARRLYLSEATVKSHLTTVLQRMGLQTRTQLAILVNRDGLLLS